MALARFSPRDGPEMAHWTQGRRDLTGATSQGHHPQPLLVAPSQLAACLTHWSLLKALSWGKTLPLGVSGSGPRPQSPRLSLCWEERDSQHQTGEGEHPLPSMGSVTSQQELPSPLPVPRGSWQVTVVTTHCPFACWRLSRFPPSLCCALCFERCALPSLLPASGSY